jgi:hypothetical protein
VTYWRVNVGENGKYAHEAFDEGAFGRPEQFQVLIFGEPA